MIVIGQSQADYIDHLSLGTLVPPTSDLSGHCCQVHPLPLMLCIHVDEGQLQ